MLRDDLGEKLAVRSAHHRVRVGDDEDVDAVGLVLQGQPYRLGAVPSVDVTPQVPLTRPRLGVEAGECMLVMLLPKVAALVVSPGAGIAARRTSASMP